MSDAIARELALEAYQAAPVGAELTERPVSDGATDYAVRSGADMALVRHHGRDDAGVDLYVYTLAVLDLGEPLAWEPTDSGAGDADTVREALLTWARAL